jgi:hypothetical protein
MGMGKCMMVSSMETLIGMEPCMFLLHTNDGNERVILIGEKAWHVSRVILWLLLYLGPCHIHTSFIAVIFVHEVYLGCPSDIYPHANLSSIMTQQNNLVEA